MNASGNVRRLDATGIASNPGPTLITPEKKIGAAVKASRAEDDELLGDTLKATEKKEVLEEAGPI